MVVAADDSCSLTKKVAADERSSIPVVRSGMFTANPDELQPDRGVACRRRQRRSAGSPTPTNEESCSAAAPCRGIPAEGWLFSWRRSCAAQHRQLRFESADRHRHAVARSNTDPHLLPPRRPGCRSNLARYSSPVAQGAATSKVALEFRSTGGMEDALCWRYLSILGEWACGGLPYTRRPHRAARAWLTPRPQ